MLPYFNVDDVAVFFGHEMLGTLAARKHGPGQVGGQQLVEPGGFQVGQHRKMAVGGVVHQHVVAAKLRNNGFHHALHVGFLAHIALDRECAEILGGHLQPRFVAATNGDFGSRRHELPGGFQANARTAARNQCFRV